METPTDRAYRICGYCDLDTAEIDRLIDNAGHNILSREELVDLYYATFERLENGLACEDCVIAVLDAAEAVE